MSGHSMRPTGPTGSIPLDSLSTWAVVTGGAFVRLDDDERGLGPPAMVRPSGPSLPPCSPRMLGLTCRNRWSPLRTTRWSS